jgi:transcriptional regulator GlxA family with amidase domain
MARDDQPAEIGLVVYPGVQLAAVHGLTDLFTIADGIARKHRNDGRPALRVTHWQVNAADGSMACVHDTCPRPRAKPEIILVPLTLIDTPAPEVAVPVARWLKMHHANGATLGSICSGVFILAETGLLSGRPASTHWTCAELLAARFPDIKISTEARLVDDGDVITAGGFMAWVEVALKLVARLAGPTVAGETARFITVDRPVSEQAYFNGFAPRLTHGDTAVLRAQHWVHGRDARYVSLTAMAAKAKLEKRTFLRRFTNATGVTPLEYCRSVRMARARELLEFSNKTQKEIAWEIGYSDPGAFTRAFQKATGLAPGGYRRRFGSQRRASAGAPEPGRAR